MRVRVGGVADLGFCIDECGGMLKCRNFWGEWRAGEGLGKERRTERESKKARERERMRKEERKRKRKNQREREREREAKRQREREGGQEREGERENACPRFSNRASLRKVGFSSLAHTDTH